MPIHLYFDFITFDLCAAQVAFGKIGDVLQDRRKRDLYEMVQYHEANHADPAREDESLEMKLRANHKYYSKLMNDVIDKYVLQCLNLNFHENIN